MENEIHKEVVETLNVVDKIEKVSVSPFFAHKVMQKITEEKEAKQKAVMPWFSTSFQLAAIALVLVINAVVLLYYFKDTNKITPSVDGFAQEYALQDQSNYILN